MKNSDCPLALEDGERFVWLTSIKDGERVYRVPVFSRNVEHAHGKMNKTEANYYFLYDTQARMRYANHIDPEYKRPHYIETNEEMDLVPVEERYKWIPFTTKFANIYNMAYVIEQYNVVDHYTKYGSDDYSTKSKVRCEIHCNGVNIYNLHWNAVGGSPIDSIFTKARNLVSEFEAIDFPIGDVDKLIGKRVWYHDQPGIIVNHMFPEDRIVIKSVREDGLGFDLSVGSKNRDKYSDFPSSEWNGSKEVHTGVFDKYIHWYRNENEV